jgi:DNA (cytosine-5)-methyltransferase 1
MAGTLDAEGQRRGNRGHGILAFGGGQNCAQTDVSTSLSAHPGGSRLDFQTETFVTHSLRGEGFDASEDGTGRWTPLVPVAWTGDGVTADPISASEGRTYTHEGTNFRLHNCVQQPVAVAFHENQRGELTVNNTAGALKVGGGKPGQGYPAVAFQPRIARNGRGNMGDVVNALQAQSGQTGKGDAAPCVATAMQVRRLTPTECERLQGFPDNYTAIPWRGKPASECPDGPRYKALGNSWAVPVVRWIGRRIAAAVGQ